MIPTWQLPVVVVVCALVAPAVAQTSEAESTAILKEVRLLRHAVESLARAGVGAQISSQRLHIYEQRRVAAANELRALAHELASVDEDIDRNNRQTQAIQELIASGGDLKQRAERTRTLEYLNESAESLAARRQKLTVLHADAEQRFALAQAEWDGVSQKLDQLERALWKQ